MMSDIVTITEVRGPYSFHGSGPASVIMPLYQKWLAMAESRAL